MTAQQWGRIAMVSIGLNVGLIVGIIVRGMS